MLYKIKVILGLIDKKPDLFQVFFMFKSVNIRTIQENYITIKLNYSLKFVRISILNKNN